MLNSPKQKLRGVVEAEHVVIVLHVVLVQKGVELFQLSNTTGAQDCKVPLLQLGLEISTLAAGITCMQVHKLTKQLA